MSVLGIDARQLRGVGPKHEGQYVREILQQMKPVRHLTRRGRPEARRFRVCLRTLPDEDLHPGMRLQALGHCSGLPIREQGEGPPACEVQQEGAVGVALPQREIVHAEDLRRNDRGAGGATDQPQEGVPTDGEA
jgi:hypothetical protein